MYKKIILMFAACLLAACSTVGVKNIPSGARGHKRVDYFAGGRQQVAFKVVAQLSDGYLQGVLRVKKVGPDDYDVLLLGEGAYKYMEAVVSSSGVAYKHLFKDADTPFARGRINQFLQLLLADAGTFSGYRVKNGEEILTYKNKEGKTRLLYKEGATYPAAAESSTLLSKAELTYDEYAPVDADGALEIPHVAVYRVGGITLDLTLISVR